MRSSGIRGRTLRAFVLFGAALVVGYAVLVFAAMQRLEDNIFIQRLDRRADELAAGLETGAQGLTAEPAPFDAFHAYIGASSLPPELRQRIADWPPGDYEFHDSPFMLRNQNEHFVAIRELDASDDLLYVVYDAVAFGTVETWWTPIAWVLGGGVLLVLALGLPFGRRLADQLALPLIRLSQLVETSSPNDLSAQLAAFDARDEVAILRDALARSMGEVKEYVERERRFTRNASHELRTPVTVIRGAADLLQRQLEGDDLASRRIARIERSVEHMDELIEAFLFLAREEHRGGDRCCRLDHVVPDVVERCRVANDGAEVRVTLGTACEIAAPANVVALTLGNLLANAVQHSPDRQVTLRAVDTVVTITDHGPGLPKGQEDSVGSPFVSFRKGGTGLGLTIVNEISDRYGWALTFDTGSDGGTITRLDFEPRSPDPGTKSTL